MVWADNWNDFAEIATEICKVEPNKVDLLFECCKQVKRRTTKKVLR